MPPKVVASNPASIELIIHIGHLPVIVGETIEACSKRVDLLAFRA